MMGVIWRRIHMTGSGDKGGHLGIGSVCEGKMIRVHGRVAVVVVVGV
jgi:hypothetical protein